MTPKRPQSQQELLEHLQDQIDFLRASSNAFDEGAEREAKRLATAIRVLVHDTGGSRSLLGQLGLKERTYLDTSTPVEPENQAGHCGLVVHSLGLRGHKFVAKLDGGIDPPELISFENWWEGVVFVDLEERFFSRRQIVLAMANTDGGAHVDTHIREDYAALTRSNSLGIKCTVGGVGQDVAGPEKSAIRQIAHELLVALCPMPSLPTKYPHGHMTMTERNIVIGDLPPGLVPVVCFQPKDGEMVEIQFATRPRRTALPIKRNAYCDCGSGLRFKKCCGQLT